MTVTQNVINDLLPVYLAGEASPDTAALIDEFLRTQPELARTIAALRANPLPAAPAAPAREKEILDQTRRLLRRRGILLGLAIFLTLAPFSFSFEKGGVTWKFLQDTPPTLAMLLVVAAAGAWAGFLNVRRRLASTGL